LYHEGRNTTALFLSSKTQGSTNNDDFERKTSRILRRKWDENFNLLVQYQKLHGNCNVAAAKYEEDPKLGGWIRVQRRRKEVLTKEQRAMLNDLGFAWSRTRTWEENFQLLVRYKEQHGDCNAQKKNEQYPTLGNWVSYQRKKKDTLTNEQRATLDDLGFSWIMTRTWEEHFQLLVQYKVQHGDCNVPQKYQQESKLGQWVNIQRKRKDKLSNEQRAKLDELGFAWSVKRTWEESFHLLVQYKEQHGDCNVSTRYDQDPTLGNWVAHQRNKKDRLTDEQRAKLDDLEFSWSSYSTWWEENFQSLVRYKEQHGDCNVSQNSKQDRILANWVMTQRRKKDKLTNEQCAKLNDLGFTWSLQPSIRRTWEENFQLLVRYKEQHGDCNVPTIYEQDPTLGNWVARQRRRKDTPNNEQRAKLDDLGFSWNMQRTWEKRFQLLVQYQEQYGDCNVPQDYEHDPTLGNWVAQQRTKKDGLTHEQRTKLDKLGLLWRRRIRLENE
jgi:hypothetical protein